MEQPVAKWVRSDGLVTVGSKPVVIGMLAGDEAAGTRHKRESSLGTGHIRVPPWAGVGGGTLKREVGGIWKRSGNLFRFGLFFFLVSSRVRFDITKLLDLFPGWLAGPRGPVREFPDSDS